MVDSRVTQTVIEVCNQAITNDARLTQTVVETPILPSTGIGNAVVTQEVLEIVLNSAANKARVTQFVIEIVVKGTIGGCKSLFAPRRKPSTKPCIQPYNVGWPLA